MKQVVPDVNAWKMFMEHGQFTLTVEGQTIHIFSESSDE